MENAANILATAVIAAAGAYVAWKVAQRIATALMRGVDRLTRHERS